jgi:predicted XRE-type DNA-binding protein
MNDENGRIGSSFEAFLKEEGTYEETTAIAVKRVLAWQLKQAMEIRMITKKRMADEMMTSRSQLDRILDPENASVQLDTLFKAAKAVGRKVTIQLV